jgi:hypothetical protein
LCCRIYFSTVKNERVLFQRESGEVEQAEDLLGQVMAAEILHHLDTGKDIPEELVVWIVAVHDTELVVPEFSPLYKISGISGMGRGRNVMGWFRR